MLRSSSFARLLLLLLVACGEKEKPESDLGMVSFTGIALSAQPAPGARTQATFVWKHLYANELSLEIQEAGSGKTYSIQLHPNDFSKPVSIMLPFGTYEYLAQNEGEPVSATLPIQIQGQLVVDQPSESALLEAHTDYGLLSLSQANLVGTPKLKSPAILNLPSKDGFYYLYTRGGENLRTELSFSNGKNYVLSTSIEGFGQHHVQVRTPGETEQETAAEADFQVTNQSLVLKENGYPEFLSPYSLTELPASQNETSGLQWIQGRLFSINDGGNPAALYELHPQTGALLRTITIANAGNTDWEDLAASPTHLFIGDFGNNAGTRTNLRILKVPLASILNQTEVAAEVIEFSYPDQSDFSGSNANHNFDCEAMLFAGNRLHLFSKNLGDLKTKHYSLSTTTGKQVAVLEESFDAKGLITGADLSPDGKNIVLLGYENKGVSSRAFLWTFAQVSGLVFSGTGNQFFLGSPATLGQTEGITIDSQLEVKISGERISFNGLSIPPKMFELDLGGIFTP